MKASVATLALVGAVAAQSPGDAAKAAIGDITTAITAFDTTVKAYNGGPATALTAASKKINDVVNSSATKISNGQQLATADAIPLVTAVQDLQAKLKTSLSDLESKSAALVSSGSCSDVVSQLQAQAAAAKTLKDAVKSKAPTGTESIADDQGKVVVDAVNGTLGKFQTACKGAPAGGASSGSSGASAPASGASSSSGASAPAAGSSSSSSGAAAPAAPSSGDTATATYGGGSEEPATSSTAPSPATYTGSAANIRVGSGITLAAVAAFWAL